MSLRRAWYNVIGLADVYALKRPNFMVMDSIIPVSFTLLLQNESFTPMKREAGGGEF